MKKLIFFFLLLFAAYIADAQDFTVYKTGVTQIVTNDTITDTGTDDVVILLKPGNDYVFNVVVQVIGTAISGTLSITPAYYTSLDGSNWELISTDTEITSANLVEFFTDENGFYGRYLKMVYTGSGTEVAKVNAYLYVVPYKNY
jgi:hypothetical protein